MKALKVMAMIDNEGQIALDHPLVTDRNSRVEVIVLIPEEEILNDQSQSEVLADFRQAWHEAMTGQSIPVAQMWEGLDHG
jgi:uncharacterized protein with ATP-grasp and redox domains